MVTDSGGGHDLNVELNLVPFIDLLSSLVLFLLVTAVWTQISIIPTAVKTAGRVPSSVTPQNRQLELRVTSRGYELTWPANVSLPRSIPKHAADYDKDTLMNVMIAASKSKNVSGANVSGEETVEYGAVIEAIDTVKSGGLPSVALKTN